MPSLIGQSLGRYTITEQLGEGGMATVYKAYDTRLERDVALKIIRKGAFPSEQLDKILVRFEREAKALAKLSHPNIVNVIDYGEHEGSPYLVMEYLPGGTLKQKLGNPMPWQEAVKLILPITEALGYAHAHNLVHRDVKPANILITETGKPMLSDFGIAKLLDSEETQGLTTTGSGIGTPEYMAPEQASAKDADARADVYSLGVVLYELVTGRKPYTADTPMAVLIMHARDPLPRPSQFVPALAEAAEKVLLKALAKHPEDRYQSMNEFAQAMEGLTAAAPTQTAKVTKPKAAKTPARSGGIRPLVVGLSALGALVFLALVAVLLLGLNGKGPLAALAPKEATSTSRPLSTEKPKDTNTPVPTNTPQPTATAMPTRTPTPSITPTPVGGEGRIVFSSSQDGKDNIYVINSDGTGLTQLTFDGGRDPAWSPDETRIAYTSYRDGHDEIYVMNADGSNPVRLTNNNLGNAEPDWEPNGSKMVFVSERTGQVQIYIMNNDGSNQYRITNNDWYVADPTWSSGVNNIAFVYPFPQNSCADIGIYYPYGDVFMQFTYLGCRGVPWHPAWSPDATKIAYILEDGNIRTIEIVDNEGNPLGQVANGTAPIWDFAWSPDGTKFVFVSGQTNNLYICNIDGSDVIQLTTNGAWSPDWSPH